MQTIIKKDLMDLGFGEYQAKTIVREAKEILVKRGFEYYANPKLGRVPAWIIEEILAFNPYDELEAKRCDKEVM